MSRWPIPRTWQWVTAGQIADIVGGGTPPSKDPGNFTSKGLPWITPADLSGYEGAYVKGGARDLTAKGYAACGARMVPKGTVLFTSRAPIGYCVIAANDICTNQGFKSLVLFSDTSPEYVRYYLLASREYAESLASGSTFLELSGGRLTEMEIPFAGAAEQRRIAEKITVLDSHSRAARKHLEAIPPLLEQFRAAVLSAAFSGGLTADWRREQKRKRAKGEAVDALVERMRDERRQRWEEERLARMKTKGRKPKDDSWKEDYRESDRLDVARLSLPSAWRSVALGQMCIGFDYGTSAKSQRKGKVAVLRMGNLQRGEIDWTDLAFTSDKAEIARYSLSPRTVLFNRTNSPDLVGKTAIYRGERPAVFAGYLVRCRTLSGLDPEYLNYVLNADFSRQHCLRVKSDAVSQSNVNATKLAGFEIPLCPVAEQREIVDRVDALLRSARTVETGLQAVLTERTTLSQAILAKSFRGELVPQNPKDEPATELLKRIAEEKEKMKAEKKATPRKDRMPTVRPEKPLAETIQNVFGFESFTFAQLRDVAGGVYEDLKSELFRLLREREGVGAKQRLRLVFDKGSAAMLLRVVES